MKRHTFMAFHLVRSIVQPFRTNFPRSFSQMAAATAPVPVKSGDHVKVCIIGSGPAAHTAALYAARAELQPVVFEGEFANGLAPGGQLTTTTEVENFPGFPEGIMGGELTEKFRKQSAHFGARLLEETVETVNLSKRPFEIKTDRTQITADTVIIATGAVAKRMDFPGAGEGPGGYWNKGVSACAVCDGAAPIFRSKHLAVVGGGDSALEEAMFLTKYASKVTIVHRRDELRASKIMQSRARANPKIEFAFNAVPIEAYGDKLLQGIKLQSTVDKSVTDLKVNGLFFGIGHKPATDFLGGQLALDDGGYIITEPGTTKTSVAGVFAAGDVQDKRYRQAITAAGSGCMAALDVEHYLTTLE
eukprot:m.222927 g.222927  ORF g.222927 m.222927 type:complete len:360 (+) comp16134_c0_seq1:53-1132(+)